MSQFSRLNAVFGVGSVLLVACSSVRPASISSDVVLAGVSQHPEDFGELIYVGNVFRLDGPRQAPLFVYERRVQQRGPNLRSVSFSRQGEQVALIQIADQNSQDELVSFTEHQFQLNEVGRVEVHGRQVDFSWVKGGEERRASETVDLPVVVGPTLYRFVLTHWDALRHGATIPFRFAVPNRLETVGFELAEVPPSENHQVRFRMRASNPFIALAISAPVLTWTADRHLVALEGRVPPMMKDGSRWVPLDAHVEYRLSVDQYR